MAKILCYENLFSQNEVDSIMKYILSEKEFKNLTDKELIEREIDLLRHSLKQKQSMIDSIFATVEMLPSQQKNYFIKIFHNKLNEAQQNICQLNSVNGGNTENA